MFSKLIVATGLLLAIAAHAAAGGADVGSRRSGGHGIGRDRLTALYRAAVKTERNIENARQFIDLIYENLVTFSNERLAAMAELTDTDNFVFVLQPTPVSFGPIPWELFAASGSSLIDVLGGFTEFNVTYRADPVANEHKVVFYPEANAMTGSTGVYAQQYVVTIGFNGDGKINFYEEFTDSLFMCGAFGAALPGCPAASA